jgi:geranylgeranyl reductase family protein
MIHENRFDAIVIGAGPAGSTAAYLLAKKGFKVLILDKKAFPRDKVCGGLLTWKTVKVLESIFQTSTDFLKSNQIILNQSLNYEVSHANGASIRGRLEHPFYFVERSAYDFFWLKMARQAGAVFRSGEKVASLDPGNNQIVTSKGNQFSGSLVLVADGALSRIRRWLSAKGFINPKIHSGLATALEVFVTHQQAPSLPDYPTIHFGHIPWGYAWCFPRENLWVLGICGLNIKAGQLLKKGFKQFLKKISVPIEHLSTAKSCALPYGNFLNQPGYKNILLLGDACGLADPLLGEGIYYAHKSAQLAAMAAVQSFSNPNKALNLYKQYIDDNILRELRYIRAGRQIIFSLPGAWPFRAVSSLLRTIPQICEETIQGQRSFRWFRPVVKDNR